jgi:Iron-sulfur cluster assembly accessory protein
MIPVEISNKALEEVKKIKGTKGIPVDYFLRIGVRGGGCSGADFYIGFDQEKETDKRFEVEGVSVLIERKDFMYLLGVRLNYVDDIDQQGFDFEKIED